MQQKTKVKFNAKAIFYIIIYFCFLFSSRADDTLRLSRKECETIFLKSNLLLMAEKLEINKADALILQASLWPNPQINVDEINLWASKKQLDVFKQDLPGINNSNIGKNQQISFSIEQLIQTAGKRNKLVELEKINKEKAKEYFEELLRNLKNEFRHQLTEMQFLQLKNSLLKTQYFSLKQLTEAYKKQADDGNISKGEYIRLKALELDFLKQIHGLNNEINEKQKELKILLQIPVDNFIVITDEGFVKNTEKIKSLQLNTLLDSSFIARPDLRISTLEKQYSKKQYELQKALKVPDITLKGGYDRGGNFMYNFVGFGASVDLPTFNRNQGNIKYAKINSESSELIYKHQKNKINYEIVRAFNNLKNTITFYESIEENYEKTLDDMFNAYIKNFKNRNISMVEFIDFLNAYQENKIIILESKKELNDKSEEINFSVGKDVIN